MGRADQHRPAATGFDESDAPEDERAHDALSQVRLGNDQRAQLLGRDEYNLDVVIGVAVNETMVTRKLRDLAGKLAANVGRDRNDMTQSIALTDGYVALEHDEHAESGFAGRKEPVALRIVTDGAEATDALDLGFRQLRKQLMTARQDPALRFGIHGPITTAMA